MELSSASREALSTHASMTMDGLNGATANEIHDMEGVLPKWKPGDMRSGAESNFR
jgi:hypothetical protein